MGNPLKQKIKERLFTMTLSEKAREERNRYQREWRKRNKDKVKAYKERYWLKKAEEREAQELIERVSEVIKGNHP